ncbi:MAG: Fe-S cluster assembly protein SufD [Pseudomonadota bacterium]
MTTALADTIARYTEAHEQMQRVLAGSEAIKALRTRAIEAFTAQGFPTPRHEDWKYTNLARIEREAFQAAAAVPSVDGDALPALSFADGEALRLVFVNGRYAPSLSDAADAALAGVHVASLAHAVDQEDERLDGLGTVASLESNGLVALNTAFLKDGALVTLDADVTLEKPLYLVFLSVEQAAAALIQPRVYLVAGRHARARVVEHHATLSEPTNFTNMVEELRLDDGARIDHYLLQDGAPTGSIVHSMNATLGRDANFTSHHLQAGSRLARQDIHVKLAAPGSSTVLNGVFLPSGEQHLDTHTRVDHLEPHTRSDEDYRGVLDGRSRGVFNGKVVVHKDAQGIEAHQSSRNLLLSERAEIDTKPELEIYADDVVCSHGATVGQLDEQAVFYLRSRGLDEQRARQLLTYAFARDLIERIDLAPVREAATRAVLARLGDSAHLLEELS